MGLFNQNSRTKYDLPSELIKIGVSSVEAMVFERQSPAPTRRLSQSNSAVFRDNFTISSSLALLNISLTNLNRKSVVRCHVIRLLALTAARLLTKVVRRIC